jgi:Fe-S cluster assembly scaffold protein SufB
VTDATPETTLAASARPPRAPRRSPNELSFTLNEAFVEACAAGEPDWLAADRRAAFERYAALPIETNQLYTTYVDLRTADLSAVEPVSASTASLQIALANIRGLSDGVYLEEEDGSLSYALSPEARESGVVLETIADFAKRDEESARRLLADENSLPLDDKLSQMTRAGWTHGLVLRVPDGVHLRLPVAINRGTAASEAGRAQLTRTIIDIGQDASASVVEWMAAPEKATARTDAQSLFTGSLEIHLAAGAELAVASIQDLGPGTVVFQHRQAQIGEGAKLHWAMAQLGGRLVRSRIDNRLAGNRSTVEQVEIVFGSDDQLFDLTSITRHIGRDTTGNLLSKAALMDATRSFMKGLIIIEPTAVGTDSFLGEFGMNLSKQARAVAIPSLEIDQPDCRRAMHSSAVGPIDQDQLFYLESRGIPPDEARKFIVLGFLEPVVARVPLAEAQDRLRELLDAKWDAGAGTGAGGVAAA